MQFDAVTNYGNIKEFSCSLCFKPLIKNVVAHQGIGINGHPQHRDCFIKWFEKYGTCYSCNQPAAIQYTLKDKIIKVLKLSGNPLDREDLIQGSALGVAVYALLAGSACVTSQLDESSELCYPTNPVEIIASAIILLLYAGVGAWIFGAITADRTKKAPKEQGSFLP